MEGRPTLVGRKPRGEALGYQNNYKYTLRIERNVAAGFNDKTRVYPAIHGNYPYRTPYQLLPQLRHQLELHFLWPSRAVTILNGHQSNVHVKSARAQPEKPRRVGALEHP